MWEKEELQSQICKESRPVFRFYGESQAKESTSSLYLSVPIIIAISI
jgi:hypothetical protein